MIWFNIEDLEDKISNDKLSDKDGFHYLLAFIIFTTTDMGSYYNCNAVGWTSFLGCIVQILTIIWGLKVVYKVNNEIDGKDFLKRFLAISWVVTMRVFVFVLIPLSTLGGFLLFMLKGNWGSWIIDYLTTSNPVRDFVAVVSFSFLPAICFLLIIQSFRNLKISREVSTVNC